METIENLKRNGAVCAAVEAGKTLIIDLPETVKLAEKYGIVLVGSKS